MLTKSELNGARMRKDLDATRVIKSYENKHKDGSGNLGFVLRYKRAQAYTTTGPYPQLIDEDWFNLSGEYRPDGTFYSLRIGAYISAGLPIDLEQPNLDFDMLMNIIRDFVQEHKQLNLFQKV